MTLQRFLALKSDVSTFSLSQITIQQHAIQKMPQDLPESFIQNPPLLQEQLVLIVLLVMTLAARDYVQRQIHVVILECKINCCTVHDLLLVIAIIILDIFTITVLLLAITVLKQHVKIILVLNVVQLKMMETVGPLMDNIFVQKLVNIVLMQIL